MKNNPKEKALKTGELTSLKGMVCSKVKNWVKIKLQLNAIIAETFNIYCQQVGMPAKDVKRIFLECLEESFDGTLKQVKKKLENLK